MLIYALVGLGPNDVEITSLIFLSKEKALEFLVPLLGTPRSMEFHNHKTDIFWEAPNWDEEKNEDYEWLPEARIKYFFTHYYDGCGGCWGFELREITEGKPFAQFDLD
jgi:hypothetical protein